MFRYGSQSSHHLPQPNCTFVIWTSERIWATLLWLMRWKLRFCAARLTNLASMAARTWSRAQAAVSAWLRQNDSNQRQWTVMSWAGTVSTTSSVVGGSWTV